MDAVKLSHYILNLDISNESDITPMKLQKLLYFCHGFHLAFTGQPLLDDGFSALKNGPVNKKSYLHFKNHGSSVITDRLQITLTLDKKTEIIVKDVFKLYNQYSASKLSQITHLPNTPWSKCFTAHNDKTAIPDSTIKEFFNKEKQQFIEAIEDLEDELDVAAFNANRSSEQLVSFDDL